MNCFALIESSPTSAWPLWEWTHIPIKRVSMPASENNPGFLYLAINFLHELGPCCFYSMSTFRHVDFGLWWSNLKNGCVFFTLCDSYLVSITCQENVSNVWKMSFYLMLTIASKILLFRFLREELRALSGLAMVAQAVSSKGWIWTQDSSPGLHSSNCVMLPPM